jgi:hypothetical protein
MRVQSWRLKLSMNRPVAQASRLRVRRASRSTKVQAARRRPNSQPWTAALRHAGSRSRMRSQKTVEASHEPVPNGARPSSGAAALASTIALDPSKVFPHLQRCCARGRAHSGLAPGVQRPKTGTQFAHSHPAPIRHCCELRPRMRWSRAFLNHNHNHNLLSALESKSMIKSKKCNRELSLTAVV